MCKYEMRATCVKVYNQTTGIMCTNGIRGQVSIDTLDR